METKYTKLEWQYSPMKGTINNCFAAQVWDSNGFSLATISSRYGEEEATANAKLIAAAPELLEACIEAEKHHQGLHSEIGGILRSAIEKATK